MGKRRKRGVKKGREAQVWSAPEPRLTLHDEEGAHAQYGTHRTASMEDRREARIAAHYGGSKFTDECLRVERPCARGTVGCSVIHRSGYERCETY